MPYPTFFELTVASLAIALNPPAVVAVILLLTASGAERKAPSFLAGWITGLLIVASALLFAGEQYGEWNPPKTPILVFQFALGTVLVVFAWKGWRDRRAGTANGDIPGWMRPIVGFSPAKAFGVAAAFAAFNPKTLAINAAGVTAISNAGLTTAGEWLALVLFVAASSITVAAPIIYHLAAPQRSKTGLESLKNWLIVNNAKVTSVVLLFLGAVLLWSGVGKLMGKV